MYNPSFPSFNTSQNANPNPSSDYNSNNTVSYNIVSYDHNPDFGLSSFDYPMFGDNYKLFQELEPLPYFDAQAPAVNMISTQEMTGISYGSSSSSRNFARKGLYKPCGDWPSNAKAEGSSTQNRHMEHKRAMERIKMGGHAVTFRTLSEYEKLDDGYKWRKYGKKMLKTSTNPRNYYKCSNEGCKVKKRVEREEEDHRYVLTTYEGIHNHQSPSLMYSCNTQLSGWIWQPSSNPLI